MFTQSQFYNKAASIPTERISHYAVVLISVLAGVLLLKQVWSIYQTSSYQPEITIDKRLTAGEAAAQRPKQDYQANSITSSNLFGVASTQGLDKLNLPTTALQLQLRGAFTSTNQKLASAIIEGPDGQARSFRVDSRVYGNAVLHAVYSDRIVLSRGGELETLYFPDPSQLSSETNATIGDASVEDIKTLVQDTMSTEEIQQASKQLRSSAMTAEQRKELIRKRLLELRNRARQKK